MRRKGCEEREARVKLRRGEMAARGDDDRLERSENGRVVWRD